MAAVVNEGELIQSKFGQIYFSHPDSSALFVAINKVIDQSQSEWLRGKSVANKMTIFIEISTWFEFKQLQGKGLVDYYESMMKSRAMGPKRTERFLQLVRIETMVQDQKACIEDFLKHRVPNILKLLQLRHLTCQTNDNNDATPTEEQIVEKAKRIQETIEVISQTLRKYFVYHSEPESFTKKRSGLIQVALFPGELTDPVLNHIRFILECADEVKLDIFRKVFLVPK